MPADRLVLPPTRSLPPRGVLKASRIFEPRLRPRWTLAGHRARPRLGRSGQSPFPKTGFPWDAGSGVAQRKYWAAAATCHMPLYFQDPMLERYGHSVEQYFGPLGRYMAYPVDHHTETTQRQQMVQPFFSVGLFCLADHHVAIRTGYGSALGSSV